MAYLISKARGSTSFISGLFTFAGHFLSWLRQEAAKMQLTSYNLQAETKQLQFTTNIYYINI